jgi:hypothetical protein
VGVNKKGVNQKQYSNQKSGVSIIEHSKPKGVPPKMRECKLRSGVKLKKDWVYTYPFFPTSSCSVMSL